MRIRRYIKLSAALLVAGLVAVFVLASGALHTYSVLTEEALVAELSFTQLGPEHFAAHLVTDDGCSHRTFEIYGDQWRIDAHFLKWHSWATLLGFDAHYRLSRIEGRYENVVEQNVRPNIAYSLAPESALDVIDLAAGMGRWNVFVDSTYGSSTFENIDTESIHRVYRTQAGLIARRDVSENSPHSMAAIQVEIAHGCGATPGVWRRLTTWADRSIRRALGRQADG